MKKILSLLVCSLSLFALTAQETFPTNGTLEKGTVYHAYEGATIHVDFQTAIENATLLVYKSKVVEVGENLVLPKGTVRVDVSGKHIYPSFIDLNAEIGVPKTERPKWNPRPQYESKKEGAFAWNQAIHPEVHADQTYAYDKSSAKKYIENGFGVVLTHTNDGLCQGTSTLVALNENENQGMLMPRAASHSSFSKGSSRQKNPSSLMGSIALLRQARYDAQWFETSANQEEENLSLRALNNQKELPQIFHVGRNKINVLRADKLGDEFGVQYIFVGNGDEYQRIDAIKATEGAFILPIDYPLPYDLSDPYLSRMVSIEDLKHWELAPSNAARMAEAGVEFAFSTDGLKSKGDFLPNVKKAIAQGLSKEDALKALTHTPAKLIGAQEQVGSLRPGLEANFILTNGDIFEKEGKILDHFIQGNRHVVNRDDVPDLVGTYNLNLGKTIYKIEVKGKPGAHKASFTKIVDKVEDGNTIKDTIEVKLKIQQTEKLITISFDPDDENYKGLVRLSGNVNSQSRIWDGKGQTPEGKWFDWTAVKQAKKVVEANETLVDAKDNTSEGNEKGQSKENEESEAEKIIFPFQAYGAAILPEQKNYWIKNATVWTCEEEGIIEKGEVLIKDGKIAAVGKNLSPSAIFPKQKIKWETIDAKGKHVSPGIIDEHSHIAIERGVNEGSDAVTAEVRIGDVVDSEDVDIYRQLSGGVVAAQLLHGSANPVGGQSALIKLRWGKLPEEMKIQGADGYIKFALGENVKQSNWGDGNTIRFPQSRMGVEQVYYDAFIKAKEYGEAWKVYDSKVAQLSNKARRKGQLPIAPRKDLELDCLLEILNSERFVSCHSYMQHEIVMLMNVADSMGFTLNTFTHILEGYKVADKMKEHGAGGSSFSDWWAYKYEVKDAIPYNGALLWEQGVVTAFNSDDAEMARRLNQEAAKAVKYGAVPEEEALKFVTLNPAKLLHLDDRMGSIKTGKDADLVIWTDHPLSIYAKAETTMIDGVIYYSMANDQVLRDAIQSERARITQLMLNEKAKGKPTQKPKSKEKMHYHCDTFLDYGR